MKSDEYWQMRALQREAESHSDAEKVQQRLRMLYEQADKNLKKQIHKIFDAYVDYTGIDEQKARELLSTQESAELLAELRKQYEENQRRGSTCEVERSRLWVPHQPLTGSTQGR